MTFEGTNVLCVGAGFEQLPAIQIAQEMGLHVIAVDGNSNAPGLSIANQGIHLDLRDVDAVISVARESQVRCVLPVPLGSILTTVGAVNDALKLRGISEKAAQTCTDKLLMRQVLAEAGLKMPVCLEATTEEALLKAATNIGWPVIIKPQFGSGNRGVYVARNKAELVHYLPWHIDQLRRTPNYQEASVVEQFFSGIEVGVDGIVVEESSKTLLIRDKEIKNLPFCFPYAFLAPSRLAESIKNKINLTLSIACNALHFNNCLFHADVLVLDNHEVTVLDISGRPSGFNLSAMLVPRATGINPIHQAIKLSLGYSIDLEEKKQGVVLRMLSANPGCLKKIEGIEKAQKIPGVVAVESFLKPGDIIDEQRTGASYRVGYLLTEGDSQLAADLVWHSAASQIHFHVE